MNLGRAHYQARPFAQARCARCARCRGNTSRRLIQSIWSGLPQPICTTHPPPYFDSLESPKPELPAWTPARSTPTPHPDPDSLHPPHGVPYRSFLSGCRVWGSSPQHFISLSRKRDYYLLEKVTENYGFHPKFSGCPMYLNC